MNGTRTQGTATITRRGTRLQAILVGLLAATVLVTGLIGRPSTSGVLHGLEGGFAPAAAAAENTIPLDELGDFVLDDLNAYWAQSFAGSGLEYTPTDIIYFDLGVVTACGYEEAAGGPFYCPADGLVYLPGEFFVGDIRSQDFAVAAVIAHEVGHHIQALMGISEAADLGTITSVQLELQADCLAGVWTSDFGARGGLEAGDYEEAVILFDSIGDDALGVPAGQGDHGDSWYRVAWFEYGYATADGSLCVTY